MRLVLVLHTVYILAVAISVAEYKQLEPKKRQSWVFATTKATVKLQQIKQQIKQQVKQQIKQQIVEAETGRSSNILSAGSPKYGGCEDQETRTFTKKSKRKDDVCTRISGLYMLRLPW